MGQTLLLAGAFVMIIPMVVIFITVKSAGIVDRGMGDNPGLTKYFLFELAMLAIWVSGIGLALLSFYTGLCILLMTRWS